MLTEERRASLLAYCKLTELADDPEVVLLIPLFYDDAVGYMEGAGVFEPPEGTKRRSQYDLLINRMVLNEWEQRDTAVVGTTVTENPAFRRKLNQLKMTEGMVSESDTGTGEDTADGDQ